LSDQNQRVCRICFAGEEINYSPKSVEEKDLSLNLSARIRSTEANNASIKSKDEKVDLVPYVKNEILLKEICKCKGTLKYVHESCLIKWLTQANTQKCELCLQSYNITYEFGSVREIAKNGF
jgi:hypothetical protein